MINNGALRLPEVLVVDEQVHGVSKLIEIGLRLKTCGGLNGIEFVARTEALELEIARDNDKPRLVEKILPTALEE